jgi:hypothetical protein
MSVGCIEKFWLFTTKTLNKIYILFNGICDGEHLYTGGSSDDNEPMDDDECLVGGRITQWKIENGYDASCEFCKILDKNGFNKENFTFRDEKYLPDNVVTDKDEIIMNNLIFNFRDYEFDIDLKKNKCTVTFNPKAIGGYKHASFSTGAVFEVQHAVPGTLEHYKTTYVNQIDITFTDFNDEIMIASNYKAIDVL